MDQPRTTLCPGYIQVDEFKADDENEYESEEEVEYVTLDLGNIEPTLVPSSSTYRLIGLDTPTPVLQLSGTILRGKHEDLLGTELIFTDDKELTERGKKSVTHVCNTSQRISFKEIRLRPKDKKEDERVYDEDEDDGLEYADPDPITADVAEEPNPEYADVDPGAGSSSIPHTLTPPAAELHDKPRSPPPVDSGEPGTAKSGAEPAVQREELPVDPAMLIDRLTGVSPLLTRTPRLSTSGGDTSASAGKGKKRTKGKGKQKAGQGEELSQLDDRMDTTEG